MKKAFEADTGRVLNIVINSLYSEKEIFLRELISNSSDALDKRRFLSLTDKNDNVGTDDLKIEIQASKKDSTLIIKDNGVGMSKEELENSCITDNPSVAPQWPQTIDFCPFLAPLNL